jgi:hypothetical protein
MFSYFAISHSRWQFQASNLKSCYYELLNILPLSHLSPTNLAYRYFHVLSHGDISVIGTLNLRIKSEVHYTSGLYYERFTIVIYYRNDSTIVEPLL